MFKVINILTHIPQQIAFQTADPLEYIQRFPETEFLYVNEEISWVGFFKNDWHHNWSKELKLIDNQLEIECWRPYGTKIKQPYEKIVDGIKHRIFPSSTFIIKKVGAFSRSLSMLASLEEEFKNHKVIIHFYGFHDNFSTWLITKLKPYNIPIIVQQLGGWFRYFDFIQTKNPFSLVSYLYEKRTLKHITKYLTASTTELVFLRKNFKHLDSAFFFNGIDLNKFKRQMAQSDAKKQLGLNADEKIILYVGRLDKTKNVDILLKAYKQLKEFYPELNLYLVGGYKTDCLYNAALEAGATIFLRTDSSLEIYYQAADVYIMPITNFGVKEFGGFGVAPIEALAFDLPVVSGNLKHFPGKKEEIIQMGILMEDENKLTEYIIEACYANHDFKGRSVAEKYFNIKNNSQHLVNIYEKIFGEKP